MSEASKILDEMNNRSREVFRLIHEERPGAGHLEFPEDIAAEECSAPLVPASSIRRKRAAQS